MFGGFVKPFVLFVSVLAGLFLWSEVAPAKDKSAIMLFPSSGSKKVQEKSDKALPEIPENLDKAKINEIVAGLSDDQVRRLLIRELETAAAAAAASANKQTAPEASGLARVAQIAERNINAFHKRLKEIRSGAAAVPDFLPKAYADVRGEGNILLMFGGIFALLASGLGAEWLFRRYAADMRKRLTSSPPAHWTVKLKRLLLCALIDFICICVFTITNIVVFFLFFNLGQGARLVFMIFLVVVLFVRGIGLLLSLFVAPRSPALRVLLLEEDTAIYVYRWIMGLVLFLGMSFLIRGLLELQGFSEESIIFLRAFNAAVILCWIIYLMFDNREAVARMICRGSPDAATGINLLRTQLASFWHLLALPYLILLWGLWVFYLMVQRDDMVIPVLALLSSLPLFLVLDWVGQRFLSTLFGLVDKQQAPEPGCEVEASDEEPTVEGATDHKTEPAVPHVSRFVPILRRCLSLSIAGIIFFWVLNLWGFEIHIGEQVTGAAIKILLIVTIAYVAWRLIEDIIKRKIREAQGDLQMDEDSEAGGEGGSRVGTLLELFRKFLLVVLWVTVGLIILSAMGINITPLLAGASILGLAIGLGTQNLIKDIVSGLFFLMDDAFRIGDYVESGKAKGTVEAITIRSLKLRHNRGMVHNVPFSQLGSIVNFSRDYNIFKLDVRVPFGTDIDKVRKIVKKINNEIDQDEELASELLGPIKSMGVNAFDDSALIVRVKFKTKPGRGSMVQRQFYKRLKEMFDEQGLEFATRHVMVRLPDEPTHGKHGAEGEALPPVATSPKQEALSAAAGAAIAAVLAEEEARRKQLLQDGEAEA
jgi:moderate conductance mechanosensitive channel